MSKMLRLGSEKKRVMGVGLGWKVCGLSMEIVVLGTVGSCLEVGENRFQAQL